MLPRQQTVLSREEGHDDRHPSNLVDTERVGGWPRNDRLPILLQTPAYMRAEIAASVRLPVGGLEARVKARLEMQQELRRRSLKCVFYIHKAALRLPVGGRDAHVEQLHHLLRMAVRSNIVIRVVPAAIGAHAGMSGSFTQLASAKYEPLVWLLGFEHVPGRHAELSPGSPDLPLVARAVRTIGAIAAPPAEVGRRVIADRWEAALAKENAHGWAVRAHMRGSTLVHSDLNPLNILVSDKAHVVDWAWWRTGAVWIDPAFLIVRLIAAGHEPVLAEEWAAQFDAFREAPDEAVTAFAASLVCLWERRFAGTDATKAAQRWAEHRTAPGSA